MKALRLQSSLLCLTMITFITLSSENKQELIKINKERNDKREYNLTEIC